MDGDDDEATPVGELLDADDAVALNADDESARPGAFEQESAEEEERHATNLELFLDLTFVFSIAQITVLFASDLTTPGILEGLLVLWLVWWLWSQFTWLGAAVDLDRRGTARLLVLTAVPPTLLMAVSIPNAYTTSGAQFGGAYLAVALWALAIQGWTLWGESSTRRAFLFYAPGAAVAPTLVLVGGLLTGNARVIVWLIAAVVDVGAALMAGRENDSGSTEWRIDPAHFSERHSLFVIIALGEVLVAAGVTASAGELTVAVGAGVVAGVLVACAYWWAYFGFVSGATERALRRTTPRLRAALARDIFSFLHFPLVAGIALYALVVKHLVAHPTEPLHAADLVILWVSVVGVLGGFMGCTGASCGESPRNGSWPSSPPGCCAARWGRSFPGW